MKQSVTRSISGTGSGPSITELQKFINYVPNAVGRVELSKIPRDRPFDPEGWTITIRYEEVERDDATTRSIQ